MEDKYEASSTIPSLSETEIKARVGLMTSTSFPAEKSDKSGQEREGKG